MLVTPILVTAYVYFVGSRWQFRFLADGLLVGVLALTLCIWIALRPSGRDISLLAVFLPLLAFFAIILSLCGWFWAECSVVVCF